MQEIERSTWSQELERIARGYAAVLFCRDPWVGATFAAATMLSPNAGILGLVGALGAEGSRRFIGLGASSNLLICNGLLIGLCYGYFFRLGPVVFAATLLAGFLAAMLCDVLAAWLYRLGRLPVLSLPFLLCVWLTLPGLRGQEGAVPYAQALVPGTLVSPAVDGFFHALAFFVFQPSPWAGVVLLAGLTWTSRYLAFLAVSGYALGALCITVLGLHGLEAGTIGFNFMLTAMALGGVFLVPGRRSFAIAMIGVGLSALLVAALAIPLSAFGMMPFVAPFLLVVLLMLAALGLRPVQSAPLLNPDAARLPEESYDSARLAAVRGGEADSIPLLLPFYGRWSVSQGFSGMHTHRSTWRHAVDFLIVEDGRSFRGTGERLDEYHCFGASAIAPASGTVVGLRNDLPDNAPGELNSEQNWGNYVLLELPNGPCALLAHLKRGSVMVQPGQSVAAGQLLASCGNSGRSSQPHLHLHVQAEKTLGSATLPFHFCGVLIQRAGDTEPCFRLAFRPEEGASLSNAGDDARLSTLAHLPAGRWLRYRVSHGTASRELRVRVTLLGQFRLDAANGASAAYEQTTQVLAFYDRQGPRDALLDAWLLALGLTPFATAASSWSDEPAARLFPLRGWERAAAALLGPMGMSLASRYKRWWSEPDGGWLQEGVHELRIAGIFTTRAASRVWFVPGRGVSQLRLERNGYAIEAQLEAAGVQGDYGVPGITNLITDRGQA